MYTKYFYKDVTSLLHIYELKIGETAQGYFAEQAGKCEFHTCVYILPNKLLAAEIKKDHNIQVGSLDSLVGEIVKLGNEYQKPISNFTRELLIEKVSRDLQQAKQLTYFTDAKTNTAFVSSIGQFISDMTNRRIESDNFTELVRFSALNADTEKNLDKLYDLAKIYTLYGRYLLALGEIDIFDRYKLALQILDSPLADNLPWQNIYISDYYSLTPLELAILQKLSRRMQVHIALVYEKGREEVFAALRSLRDTLLGFAEAKLAELPNSLPSIAQKCPLAFLAANLYNTAALAWPDKVERVKLQGFYDKNQELLYIISDIKRKLLDGAQLGDFVIIGRDLTAYPNLSEYFERAGIPSSLPQIVHVRKHFLSSLITDMLGLAALPFSKTRLQKVLFSPVVIVYLDFDKDQIEKIFYEYEIDSFSQLKALLTHIEKQQGLKLESTVQALANLEKLLHTIPRKATAQEYAQCMHQLMQELRILPLLGQEHRLGKLDSSKLKVALEVYQALQEIMENLHTALSVLYGAEYKISALRFSQYLTKALADKTLTLAQGNQSAVKIIQAADIQSLKVAHIYILGLNDGLFPKYKRDNWLLSSSELYNLQISLPNEAELAASEDAFFFTSALTMATQSLTLTYLDNERARQSKYLPEIKRIMPQLSADSHRNMLPIDLSSIYDSQSLSDFLAFRLGCQATLPTAAGTWLGSKWQAAPEQLLATVDNSALDVSELSKASRPYFSITQLEDYATCPFKYLLSYLWKPTAWRLSSVDNTALTKGSFLHKVAEQFVQRYIDRQLPPLQQARAELAQIFEQSFAAMPAENTYTWSLSQKQMRQLLFNWLAAEYENIGEYKFYATEWEFGNHGEFKIANLHITGKIDRIDLAPASIRITDYKFKNLVKFKSFEDNRANLQIPLYMLAVDSLLNNNGQKHLVGNYYSFAKAQTSSYLDTAGCDISEINTQISTIINEIDTAISQGNFQPTLNPSCEYCDYAPACRATKSIVDEEEASE